MTDQIVSRTPSLGVFARPVPTSQNPALNHVQPYTRPAPQPSDPNFPTQQPRNPAAVQPYGTTVRRY